MGWSHVCIKSICSIDNKSIYWTINKSVKEKQKKYTKNEIYLFILYYRIGYSIPMFSGFVIMFLSTLSKN
jgi:hypothetical protein